MAQVARKQPSHMTVGEFLAWDDGTDTRYELMGGEVFAMAPPSRTHSRIVMNLGGEIRSQLRPPCAVDVEAGIRLQAKDDTCYQADLAVSCQPLAPDQHVVPEPMIIIEVLSPSTAPYDRGTKLPHYRSIPSVREIVLVSTSAVGAEIWRRTPEGWAVSELGNREDVIRLGSAGVAVPLSSVYEGVAFEEPPEVM